jgi:hypothetical protein
MTNLLQPAPVSSDRFLWDAATRTFIAEASDLGREPFGRVFSDACDEGLTLLSSRHPGQQIVFTINHVERDDDGDTLYWDLVPALRHVARRTNFTIRVFND